jgi:ABC transporter substrate binding protein
MGAIRVRPGSVFPSNPSNFSLLVHPERRETRRRRLLTRTATRRFSCSPPVDEPNSGLIVLPDSFLIVHRAEVISLAARYRLPAVYPYRQFAELGGLLSYGIDRLENWRRAAGYVDRILKGEKPADLPVQAPTKYDLVLNLKTAKALGLDVPWILQQRADEVIE